MLRSDSNLICFKLYMVTVVEAFCWILSIKLSTLCGRLWWETSWCLSKLIINKLMAKKLLKSTGRQKKSYWSWNTTTKTKSRMWWQLSPILNSLLRDSLLTASGHLYYSSEDLQYKTCQLISAVKRIILFIQRRTTWLFGKFPASYRIGGVREIRAMMMVSITWQWQTLAVYLQHHKKLNNNLSNSQTLELVSVCGGLNSLKGFTTPHVSCLSHVLGMWLAYKNNTF